MKAIIFDMDGVMIDSEYAYTAAIKAEVERLGHAISEEYIYSFVGTTHEYTWEHIVEDYALPEEPAVYIEQMLEKREQIVLRDGLKTYPYIREFIVEASEKGYLLAVASSSPKSEIIRTVEHLDADVYFNCLVSGEEVEHSKPAPDVFLRTAEILGVAPEDCIVIEDSRNGSLAAQAAGMYCIGYRDSQYPEQDLSATAKIVSDFRDIKLEPAE